MERSRFSLLIVLYKNFLEFLDIVRKIMSNLVINPIQYGRPTTLLSTSFSPKTSTNVGISPKKLCDFYLQCLGHTYLKLKAIHNASLT